MKRFALLVVLSLALAAPAFGQNVGNISTYSDNLGNSCEITDAGGFLQNVFVVHKFGPSDAATASRFKMIPPAGATWAYVTKATTFTPVGEANVDVAIAYGVCQSTDVVICQVFWTSVVPSPACGYVNLAAGDSQADIIATDCSFGEYHINHGQAIVNPNGSCPCNIATEPTSWGKVKALYR